MDLNNYLAHSGNVCGLGLLVANSFAVGNLGLAVRLFQDKDFHFFEQMKKGWVEETLKLGFSAIPRCRWETEALSRRALLSRVYQIGAVDGLRLQDQFFVIIFRSLESIF